MRWSVLLFALVLILLAGCAGGFEPKSAAIGGVVELETPTGVVSVELRTGLVTGRSADSYRVRSVTVDAEVAGEQDGYPASVRVLERLRADAEWKPCTEVVVHYAGAVLTRAWGCDPVPVERYPPAPVEPAPVEPAEATP